MTREDEPGAGWITVASYLGLDGDLQADLLVMNLQGNGIPALRLPSLPMTVLLPAWLPGVLPIFISSFSGIS